MGNTTVGSDGSVFTQMGSFSSDGSARMGSGATGIGAVFNQPSSGIGDLEHHRGNGRTGMNSDDW